MDADEWRYFADYAVFGDLQPEELEPDAFMDIFAEWQESEAYALPAPSTAPFSARSTAGLLPPRRFIVSLLPWQSLTSNSHLLWRVGMRTLSTTSSRS